MKFDALCKRLRAVVPAHLASGGPCDPDDIDALEKRFERPLPPSYRAFLSLFGARDEAEWEGNILGPGDFDSEDVQEAIADLEETFANAPEATDPFAEGAITILLLERRAVLLVPPARAGGEMAVVEYDLQVEVARSPDLVAFMERELAKTRSVAAQPITAAPTVRSAIDAVLAASAGQEMGDELREQVVLRLCGTMPDGDIPFEAVLKTFADVAEVSRFFAALRGLTSVHAETLPHLVYWSAHALLDRGSQDVAIAMLDLARDVKPGRGNENWLEPITSAIDNAKKTDDRALAAKLEELIRPFRRLGKRKAT